MSTNLRRVGVLMGSAMLLAVAIAAGQDRKGGEPAAGATVHVFNAIEGRMVVISSRPDGSRVEKDDVVVELDPTELKERLDRQEIVIRGALSDVQGARLAHEAAMMALTRYKEGRFILDRVSSEGEIKLAESNLSRAEDRLDWARRMFEKGYVSMAERVSEELALKKARFALEEAQSRLKVLLEYTKDLTIKTLMGEVESTRACELAKQATLERERSVQRRLEDQIRRCKVAAPVAGRIHYNGTDRARGGRP